MKTGSLSFKPLTKPRLKEHEKVELTIATKSKTDTRTLDLLRPTTTVILIFYQNYVAYLSPLEHQELVLTLDEDARKKILVKTRRLRRSLANQLMNPRPP